MEPVVRHDSHRLHYRQPFGAVPCGQRIRLRLNFVSGNARAHLRLKIEQGGLIDTEMLPMLPLTGSSGVMEVEFDAPKKPALLWYDFVLNSDEGTFYYGSDGHGGEGLSGSTTPYQITVYDRAFDTPRWFRGKVMYQIFPDRFYREGGRLDLTYKPQAKAHDSWDDMVDYLPRDGRDEYVPDDFFGGNLQGIITKLPYLRELGVEVLYLNPIFEASSNHRYDIGDFHKIDPTLGTNEDFIQLCEKAQEHGMHVLLDGVFSHTGSDSVYFNRESNYDSVGAYQSKDSPYYPWYTFRDYPNDYACWWNVPTLPEVRKDNPEFQRYMLTDEEAVVKYWLRGGAKGWRLDVADELPDQFLTTLRTQVKSVDPQAVVLGEVWEDATNKMSYGKRREFMLGNQLDSVMNYPLRDGLLKFLLGDINAHALHERIMSLHENYPKPAFHSLMNMTGTHDVPRLISLLAGVPQEHMTRETAAEVTYSPGQLELGRQLMELYLLMIFTMPGVPSVYYGDELGLTGMGDPFCRMPFPWRRLNTQYPLHTLVSMLAYIRRDSDALTRGDFMSMPLARGDAYAVVRMITNGKDVFGEPARNGTIISVINRSDLPRTCRLELDMFEHKAYMSLDGREFALRSGTLNFSMPGRSGMLLTGMR